MKVYKTLGMIRVYLIDSCLFLLICLMSVLRYALRLDVQDNDSWRKRLSEWCSGNANGFIVAFESTGEEGENTHIHAILDSVKSIKQLRNSLTRGFPECVGNKGYSLKLCDDDYDAYIRYICKGVSDTEEPVIWCKQGLKYTAKDINDAWQMYWVNNKAIEENAKKRKRVEKESIVEQVEKLAKREGLKGHERVEVAKIYIRLFRDARKGINVFAAKAVVNTVCCLLDGSAEDFLASKIADL